MLAKKHDIDEIKNTMIQGGRPTACAQCWMREDQGIKSDRQQKNETLDFLMDKDIESIQSQALEQGGKILMLKLFTSFTCNATCVPCDANLSSGWNLLNKKIDPSFRMLQHQVIDFEKIKNQVDFASLVSLSLLGGEPFYEKKNLEILEYVLSQGNDKVFLNFVTNGSVELNNRWKKVLSRFKNINFSISVDGVAEVFEYARYPLSWQQLNKNLRFYHSISNNISSNYTVTNVNIFYHDQTVDWFLDQKLPFMISPVQTPTHFHFNVLPKPLKLIIAEKIARLAPEYQLRFDYDTPCDMKYGIFRRAIEQQDRAKGIHIKDYLPEFYQSLDLDY